MRNDPACLSETAAATKLPMGCGFRNRPAAILTSCVRDVSRGSSYHPAD